MKKTFAIILIALVAFSAFSAGTKETATTKPVITFYHGWFQDDWQPAAEMCAMYDEFAALHADEFEFKAIALDSGNQGVYDKCIQEIALGRFPDVVDVAGMNIVPPAVAAGVALDLKPYIDADKDFKAGIGVNYEQNMYEGKIYTVRDQLETIGFWYNEDLFNKAGAVTPDKWNTWEDFITAVAALKACPEVETPFTMNQGWPSTILFSGYLLGTEEGRKLGNSVPATYDNEAFKDALSFVAKQALAQVDNEHFTASDSDRYREDFFDGKSAMLFNGVWESGSFGSVSVKPEYIKPAFFPTHESGKKAAIVSASPGFVINAKLDDVKKNACIEFVKFMTSKATATKVFEKAMAMPPSTAIDYDTYINGNYDVTVKALAAACKAALEADYQSPTAGAAWGQDVNDAINGKFAGLRDGSKTVEQAVKEINTLL
ncbi:MAG: carbohydrate ABC transporter substrate-binding protein [Spirochaetales bacterium]|nr:carbohydrate ABC transporter substrate-binding protein [Spirochaetales bacterium]